MNSKQWTDIHYSDTSMHGFVDVANVFSTTSQNFTLVMETDHPTWDIWLRTPSLGPTNFIQLIKCLFNSITIFLQKKYMPQLGTVTGLWLVSTSKLRSMPKCLCPTSVRDKHLVVLVRSKWIQNQFNKDFSLEPTQLMVQVPCSRKIFFNWYINHVGTIENMDCSRREEKNWKLLTNTIHCIFPISSNSFVLVDLVTNKTL